MKKSDLGLNQTAKPTCKRAFIDEMNRVVPWSALVELIAAYAPEGKRGRPPFSVEIMLRVHFIQQWFTQSDRAMDDALHDMPSLREFAGQDNWTSRLPDETTMFRFRHLLEKHKLSPQILAVVNALPGANGLMLRAVTVLDATLVAAPPSTKNTRAELDPDMHQSKNGNVDGTPQFYERSGRSASATWKVGLIEADRPANRIDFRRRPAVLKRCSTGREFEIELSQVH